MADKITNFEDYKKRGNSDDIDIEIVDPYNFFTEEEREEYFRERQKQEQLQQEKEKEESRPAKEEHEYRSVACQCGTEYIERSFVNDFFITECDTHQFNIFLQS